MGPNSNALTLRYYAGPPCISPAALLYYHQGPRSPAFLVCCCDFRGVAERPPSSPARPCHQKKPPDCRFYAVFRGLSYSGGSVPAAPRRRRRAASCGPWAQKKTPTVADAFALNKFENVRAFPALNMLVPVDIRGFSSTSPGSPALSRVSQLSCPRTSGKTGRAAGKRCARRDRKGSTRAGAVRRNDS